MQNKFVVEHRAEGQIGYLDFPRDVTAQTREGAYQAYFALVRARVRVVGMNFEASEYLNSAGIGLIISLVEDAVQVGRRVYGYGLSAHYRKLFGMVGLSDQMVLVSDVDEMLLQVGGGAEAG